VKSDSFNKNQPLEQKVPVVELTPPYHDRNEEWCCGGAREYKGL